MRPTDADALAKRIQYLIRLRTYDAFDCLNEIEAAPTIDAVPVVHAHWEKVGKHDWQCSACKIGVPYSFTGFHYCHNCGAKMDEK